MQQENYYHLLSPNELILVKHGDSYLTYKVVRVNPPTGMIPYLSNTATCEQILTRDGKVPKLPNRNRIVHSYHLRKKVGDKVIRLEDFLEDCRRNLEFYTEFLNQNT